MTLRWVLIAAAVVLGMVGAGVLAWAWCRAAALGDQLAEETEDYLRERGGP